MKIYCAISGYRLDAYPEFISTDKEAAQERLEKIVKIKIGNPSEKDPIAWWNYQKSSFYWRDSKEHPDVQELMAYQKYFHDDVVGFLKEDILFE